jgi:hypothetical protein
MPWPEGFPAPGPAAKLAKVAEVNGWTVALTYARGYAEHGNTGEPILVHSVAVRFTRALPHARRSGYVVYHAKVAERLKWEAKTLCLYGTDHWPMAKALGVTDVQTYLSEGPEWTGAQIGVWRDKLVAKALDAKERAKAAAAARPKKAKVV